MATPVYGAVELDILSTMDTSIVSKVSFMKLKIILPVLILLLAAACSPAPQLLDEKLLHDTSLITNDPCEAPCWLGIVPGETSWRDASIVIEDHGNFANIETLEDEQGNTDAKMMSWTEIDGSACCRMYTRDGNTVSALLLLLAPDLTLQQVMDVQGEPDYLIGEPVTDDQALVSLIYPDKQLVVYAFTAGEAEGQISGESPVIGSIYLDDEDMTAVMSTTSMYQWDGYASLSDYISKEYDYIPESTLEPETNN
ncbi:hypothetical protein MASR2M15_14900 [Anaerolineales bacterium]